MDFGEPSVAPTGFETPAAFNMRLCTLSNMRANLAGRNPTKFQTPAIVRISQHVCSDVNKTLELLRLIIQPALNKEIDAVINKYVEKFFVPAVRNIRINYGEHVVDERHLNHVCCQMLDNAKKLFEPKPAGKSTEMISPKTSELPPPTSVRFTEPVKISVLHYMHGSNNHKLKCMFIAETFQTAQPIEVDPTEYQPTPETASSSEVMSKPQTSDSPCSSRGTPNNLKLSDVPMEEMENWNPARIDSQTRFITGFSANKCLGLAKSKCKIYSKYPSLFRYIGDSQDRQWLVEQKFHSAKSQARVFISLLSDVQRLADSRQPQMQKTTSQDDFGFQLPMVILLKVKSYMQEVYEELCKRRDADLLAQSASAGL